MPLEVRHSVEDREEKPAGLKEALLAGFGKMTMEGELTSPEFGQQRRYPRKPCNRSILISYRDDELRQLLHGRCVSVSEGGVGAILDGHLTPDQTVSIEFAGRGGRVAFRIDARVRYNRGFHHGFELNSSDETQRGRLRDVCDDSAWN